MRSPRFLEETQRAIRRTPKFVVYGRVARVTGMLMDVHIEGVHVGSVVEIERSDRGTIHGEVVGFRDGRAIVIPHGEAVGVALGARVKSTDKVPEIAVGNGMLGRIVDAFGVPLDGGPNIETTDTVPIEREAVSVEQRVRVHQRFETGVRVVDCLLTCGRGQRVGLFAGAGVGKTVLIRQIARQTKADVTVIGLIGERGNEVRDLLETDLGPRAVVVVATSDRPAMERVRGARAATSIAEYFRDKGASVLLVLDSLTRFAMALREVGLAAGEPPATKGYPPSVFSTLPRLLERVSPLEQGGSITGFYTVLVEGDDLSDPVADSARSLLDGHIVLSRAMAMRGHFPAIDVLASASRVSRNVSDKKCIAIADRAREMLATKKEVDELRSLGAYVPGANPAYDEALVVGAEISEWSRQRDDELVGYEDAMAKLGQILEKKMRSR